MCANEIATGETAQNRKTKDRKQNADCQYSGFLCTLKGNGIKCSPAFAQQLIVPHHKSQYFNDKRTDNSTFCSSKPVTCFNFFVRLTTFCS